MSRGIVSSTVRFTPDSALEPAIRFTVSRDCIAATAAPDSAAAAIVRAMRSALANGRAASWMTMTSVAGPAARKALATESWRRSPPATMRSRVPARARKYSGGSSTSDCGSATITASISGCAANAATLRSRIGRPPTGSNCFGPAAPKRRPRPPAAMMAVTCIS